MSLAPLINAPLAIQIHAYAALVLGIVRLARMKGTTGHRALGYAWVALMLVVAVSSVWIQELRVWGSWSPIHLLSLLSLTMLPLGIHSARSHIVRGHRAHHARNVRRRIGHSRHLHPGTGPHHVGGFRGYGRALRCQASPVA